MDRHVPFPVYPDTVIEKRYKAAKEDYALMLGIHTDAVIEAVIGKAVSLHCWQGDDVGGFEHAGDLSGSGLAATGNFPGKARNPDELRQDAEQAFSMIPANQHRFNLHAFYLDTGGKKVDRDQIMPEHFSSWVGWAKSNHYGLDFNGTFFSHPKAASGFTLSHPDKGIRDFWIEHGARCRAISAYFARSLDDEVVNNIWIPDGMKDVPADRSSPRQRLMASLSEILKKGIDPRVKESVEGKLFGIGSEAYVVGSHEFYLLIARELGIMPCLDMGHYHPTENVADKVSALLPFFPSLLMHVSRGVRWDSDHAVIKDDPVQDVANEIVRCNALKRIYLSTDFFDASINRVGAWVIGQRSVYKALLQAMLDPIQQLKQLEAENRGYEKLALMEAAKQMPSGAVWDYLCLQSGVPTDMGCMNQVVAYERSVQSKR